MRPATLARAGRAARARRRPRARAKARWACSTASTRSGTAPRRPREPTGWPVRAGRRCRARRPPRSRALVAGFAQHRARRQRSRASSSTASAAPRTQRCSTPPSPPRLPEHRPSRRRCARGRDLALPERHLGLVQAREQRAPRGARRPAAALSPPLIDLDAASPRWRGRRASRRRATGRVPLPPLGQRIAVARDDAFAFAYPAMLAGLAARRRRDPSPSRRSPTRRPPPDCDAVFLPGGYPELHAGRLARSRALPRGLRRAAARGAVVYGECGGYMALGRGLIDGAGGVTRWPGCCRSRPAFAARRLTSAIARPGCSRRRAGPCRTPPSAATSFTTPA